MTSSKKYEELLSLPPVDFVQGLTTEQREVIDSIMDSVFEKLLEDGTIKEIPPKRKHGTSQRVHAAPLNLKHFPNV